MSSFLSTLVLADGTVHNMNKLTAVQSIYGCKQIPVPNFMNGYMPFLDVN